MPLNGRRLSSIDERITSSQPTLSTHGHAIGDNLPTTGFAARQSSLHAHPRHFVQSQSLPYQSSIVVNNKSSNPDNLPQLKISKRRTGIGPNGLQSIPRRSLIPSQDTVIVNQRPRDRRKNTSETKDVGVVDDLRRKAEGEYYEHRDNNSVFRRRSMMRTVSKEDYLLGRGANPRTGLVTPGGGSIDSSIDNAEHLSPHTGTPSKWRQKGDQWVSLDVGEPTPGVTPALESFSALPKVKRPQTPKRAQKSNTDDTASSYRQHSRTNAITPASTCRFGSNPKQNPTSLPGAYPESPVKQLAYELVPVQRNDIRVKRKPVGGLPQKQISTCETVDVARHDEHVTPSLAGIPIEDMRSFSTPVSRKEHFSPADFGANASRLSPSISNNTLRSLPNVKPSNKPFLGLRSLTMTDLYHYTNSRPSQAGANLDKELPCLPTSSGPYPPILSPADSTTKSTPTRTENRSSKESHQGMLSTPPKRSSSVSRRSHIADMIMPVEEPQQSRSLERPISPAMEAVPDYDNPPRDRMQWPPRSVVKGPRRMPQFSRSKPYQHTINTVFTDPFSTTSMNTDMSIRTTNNRIFRQRFNTSIPPNLLPPPSIPLPPIPAPVVRPRTAPSSAAKRVDDSIWSDQFPPCIPPRSLERPQMPVRSKCMQQIPKMKMLQPVCKVTPTELHTRSNTIGMPALIQQRKGDVNIMQAKAFDQRGDLPVNTIQKNLGIELERTEQASVIRQTRRCSRCQNGLVVSTAYQTDGQMDVAPHRRLSTNSSHAPEAVIAPSLPTPITEVTEPRSSVTSSMSPVFSEAPSATILDVANDLRDHSACCPDCCMIDCHEGCLGHPSPCPSPTKSSFLLNRASLHRSDSSSTLVSLSGSSLSSSGPEGDSKKLTLIKSALKLPFWRKKPSESSLKHTNHDLKKQSLQRKDDSTSKPQLPSPNTNDRNADTGGAVAAAKKAIGYDFQEKSPENGLNQLLVPKKRPKLKKVPVVTINDETTVCTLTPPPTPPTIKVSITANECRKISGSRPCSGTQSIVVVQPSQSRTISGTSVDIRIPPIETMGLVKISEFCFMVPFEATRMWLHNNPQVMDFGWSALGCGWSMGCECMKTGNLLLNTMYIYSKTGRLKVKNDKGEKIGVHELIISTARAFLTLLVFASLGLIIVRFMRCLVWPLRILTSIGGYLLVGKGSPS